MGLLRALGFWAALPLLLIACSESTNTTGKSPGPSSKAPGKTASAIASAPGVVATAPAVPGPVSPEKVPEGARSCGPVGCLEFASAGAAFDHLLTENPKVLAIGEAHAQAGTEKIISTTRRFTEQLLPRLEGKATDLVLELWFPNPKCKKTVAKVRKQQKAVTKTQAKSNPNEYIELGNAAKKLKIHPRPLKPSCETLSKITKAGQQDIAVMLETVASHTARDTISLLQRRADAGQTPMVLAYGGLMHNDPDPGPGRESWSFGPQLVKATGGKYLAVDLIVPEYIRDTKSWKRLPWYPHYDPKKLGKKTVLYQVAPRSYVLVFPRQ